MIILVTTGYFLIFFCQGDFMITVTKGYYPEIFHQEDKGILS